MNLIPSDFKDLNLKTAQIEVQECYKFNFSSVMAFLPVLLHFSWYLLSMLGIYWHTSKILLDLNRLSIEIYIKSKFIWRNSSHTWNFELAFWSVRKFESLIKECLPYNWFANKHNKKAEKISDHLGISLFGSLRWNEKGRTGHWQSREFTPTNLIIKDRLDF